ncbi:MAG: hypothetical protein WBX15_12185 [Thermoanaerobaculia bacterium]
MSTLTTPTKRAKKLNVTEKRLQEAASRLLPRGDSLVSTEVDYLQRHLGNTATQKDIDDHVISVRNMPWSRLMGD